MRNRQYSKEEKGERHGRGCLSSCSGTAIPERNMFSCFTPWYHFQLICKEFARLCIYFFKGKTFGWVLKFLRLMGFTFVLFPAFTVFLWYYFISSDRKVYSYIEDDDDTPIRRTSRNYVDVYGSCEENCKGQITISDKGRSKYLHSNIVDNESSSFSCDDDKNTFRDVKTHDSNSMHETERFGKPVVIFLTGGAWTIGYKMWGAFLARALVPMGILVIIPDYRNFPQAVVNDMVEDIDESIKWTINNCDYFGGDPNKVCLVGQSAGAHLGAITIIRKILSSIRTSVNDLNFDEPSTCKSWKATDLKGFMAVSGPYNMMNMREIFYRHGLPKNVINAIFCNNLEGFSPVHLLESLMISGDKGQKDFSSFFPPISIIHGTSDKTVPVREATEFAEILSAIGVQLDLSLYDGWTHTDAILEAPMDGNHRFHADILKAVSFWTGNSNLYFDEQHSACKRICPKFLIVIGRWLNPF